MELKHYYFVEEVVMFLMQVLPSAEVFTAMTIMMDFRRGQHTDRLCLSVLGLTFKARYC